MKNIFRNYRKFHDLMLKGNTLYNYLKCNYPIFYNTKVHISQTEQG